MKKIISMFFALCITASLLASCGLIRKYEAPSSPDTTENEKKHTSGADSDFPETNADEKDEESDQRYSESEAFDLLKDSLTEEEKETVRIETTGALTAQSNGNEYYIFAAEKEAAEENGESEKFSYYVSTNGNIFTSLEEDNVTTLEAQKIFTEKNGESDKNGKPYVIKYTGVVMNINAYCYNFEVYAGEGDSAVYKTNFLVSLDGHSYGEQVMK